MTDAADVEAHGSEVLNTKSRKKHRDVALVVFGRCGSRRYWDLGHQDGGIVTVDDGELG